MHKVLITNDDGYKAAGIQALLAELSDKYDVTAVAPAHEQSWVAKSISRHRDLTLAKIDDDNFLGYSVDGTPADCAQVGIYEVLDELPDFVVSGINHGSNVGHEEIMSSGTVGAALEASLQGVPAFAISISSSRTKDSANDFKNESIKARLRIVAKISAEIIEKVMSQGFPPDVQIISINMPYDVKANAKWVITKPHSARHESLFAETNGKYRHKGGVALKDTIKAGTDLGALENGFVSILPIKIEMTSAVGQASLSNILAVPIYGE